MGLTDPNKEDMSVSAIRSIYKKCLLVAAVAALALGIIAGPALAVTEGEGLYSAVIFSPSHPEYSYEVLFDTLEGLMAWLQDNPPLDRIPDFVPETDALFMYLNYGGLAMTIRLPADSSDFTLEIPALDVQETFSSGAGDRQEALTALVDWVDEDPDGVMEEVETYVANQGAAVEGGGGRDFYVGCFIGSLLE